MPLREDMAASGEWLFTQRSFLPLLLAVPIALALPGFHYPLGSPGLDLAWKLVCLGVSLGGLALRVLTVGRVPFGTSGRNTREQVAQVLNTTGMYSVVRNPLYLANYLIWLGVSLVPRMAWLTLVITLIFWLYYERIILAEEDFLRERFGPEFLAWAQRTPAFLPRGRHWTPAALPFSWKTVVRREYSTLFAILTVFFMLQLLTAAVAEGRLVWHPLWVRLYLVGAVFYGLVRLLKKKTALLQEPGR